MNCIFSLELNEMTSLSYILILIACILPEEIQNFKQLALALIKQSFFSQNIQEHHGSWQCSNDSLSQWLAKKETTCNTACDVIRNN